MDIGANTLAIAHQSELGLPAADHRIVERARFIHAGTACRKPSQQCGLVLAITGSASPGRCAMIAVAFFLFVLRSNRQPRRTYGGGIVAPLSVLSRPATENSPG